MSDDVQIVFRPGTSVVVGQGIPAVVLGVEIRAGETRYEVAWWDKASRITAWVSTFEVAPVANTDWRKIGFVIGNRS